MVVADPVAGEIVEIVAHRLGNGEVHRRARDRGDLTGRNLVLVDRQEPIGVDRSNVVENQTGPGQVPVGVVGQVDRGRSVRGRRIGNAQFVFVGEGVDDLNRQIPGIALLPILAQIGEPDPGLVSVVERLGLPHRAGQSRPLPRGDGSVRCWRRAGRRDAVELRSWHRQSGWRTGRPSTRSTDAAAGSRRASGNRAPRWQTHPPDPAPQRLDGRSQAHQFEREAVAVLAREQADLATAGRRTEACLLTVIPKRYSARFDARHCYRPTITFAFDPVENAHAKDNRNPDCRR